MQSDKIVTGWASIGRENYPKAQLRFIKSCIDSGWDGDYLMQSLDGYCDNYMGIPIELGRYPQSIAHPLHNNQSEIPFGFKPTLIQEAREKGYKKILYCDSQIMMLKNPDALFDLAKEKGIVAFENQGFPLKDWISDISLERLEITVEELEDIKQIMCCVLVWDFNNEIAVKVFDEWIEKAHDGVSFQGNGSIRVNFKAPRWDQSCLSGILWKNNVELLPYGGLCYHPHEETKEFGEPIYFVNKAIG